MEIATREIPLGYELPPISNKMTMAKFLRYEDKFPAYERAELSTRNIHTDPEAAAREGLQAPNAPGPIVASAISRMMLLFLGKGWIQGGKIAIKLTRHVLENDFITARGVVTGKVLEPEGVRVLCDVWVENQRGEKVIVGTASGLVP